MVHTKRIWVAKPFLIAYVVILGFTVGLLISRRPEMDPAVPAAAGAGYQSMVEHGGQQQRREPPLWLQLFRPTQATARLALRAAIPHLWAVDGSALSRQEQHIVVYWTGKYGEKPQTLFQTMLPFLRQSSTVALQRPPAPEVSPPAAEPPPVQPDPPPQTKPESGTPTTGQEGGTAPGKSKPAINMGLPLVGVYHTHDWESYISEFPGLSVRSNQDLAKVVSYDGKKKTIVDLGNALAVHLRDEGVTTVHAPFKHQDLGYDFAYRASRDTVKKILERAPTTRVLLDLHRDGVVGLNSTTVINGQKVAQIRCIIGQYQQPKWEKNQAFCESLMARLEKLYPGLTLPTRVQNDTYNQDIMPGAILLEIGNAMNRYEEAERAVAYLAKALAAAIRDGDYPK